MRGGFLNNCFLATTPDPLIRGHVRFEVESITYMPPDKEGLGRLSQPIHFLCTSKSFGAVMGRDRVNRKTVTHIKKYILDKIV